MRSLLMLSLLSAAACSATGDGTGTILLHVEDATAAVVPAWFGYDAGHDLGLRCAQSIAPCPSYTGFVDAGAVSLWVYATGFVDSRVTLDVKANQTAEQTVVMMPK